MPTTDRSRPTIPAERAPYHPGQRAILVTGARSFLGSELIRRLELDTRCAKIIAIVPPSAAQRDEEIPTLVSADTAASEKTLTIAVDLATIEATSRLCSILRHHQVDTIVHLAFHANPGHKDAEARALEADGTRRILAAAEQSQVRKVIVESRTSLYGAKATNPHALTEDAPLGADPDAAFFAHKLAAEVAIERFRHRHPECTVTVLRFAPILGRRIGNYVSRYLSAPLVPTLRGYDPLVQFLGEDDALQALKLCVDADFNGAYNLAADAVLPLHMVIALLGRIALPLPLTGIHLINRLLCTLRIAEFPETFVDFLRYICVADTKKSRAELGFHPHRDLRSTIIEFAEGRRTGGENAIFDGP